MKQTKTPREWYEAHVNVGMLVESVKLSIAEAVNNDSMDMDGENYLGLVYDIVSSRSGNYIPFYALEYFDYEIDTDNIEQYDFEEVLYELDGFTSELEEIINDEIGYEVDVEVQFGYWEADGTYCMMALSENRTV